MQHDNRVQDEVPSLQIIKEFLLVWILSCMKIMVQEQVLDVEMIELHHTIAWKFKISLKGIYSFCPGYKYRPLNLNGSRILINPTILLKNFYLS